MPYFKTWAPNYIIACFRISVSFETGSSMKLIPLADLQWLQWNSLQQHELLFLYYRPSQTEIDTLLVHSINLGRQNGEWRHVHVVAIPVTYQKMDASIF